MEREREERTSKASSAGRAARSGTRLAVAILGAAMVLEPAWIASAAGDEARSAASGRSRHGVAGAPPVEDPGPQRIQRMGVRTAVAKREALATELRAPGHVALDEGRRVSVTARFSAFVEAVLVSDGQLVAQGDVLAVLYSPDAIAAQQQLLAVRRLADPRTPGAARDLATNAERDARARLAALGFAPQDVAALLATAVPSKTVNLRAPIAGFVSRRGARTGGYAPVGTELFQLTDLSTVWVVVDVPVADVSRVRVGQRAAVELTALRGEHHTGRVTFVSPALAQATRSLQVRITVPNRHLRLRPGMLGDATLEAATPAAVTVPADAVVDTGERRWVFVAEGDGRFLPRAVTVGWVENGKAALLTGVAEGERVAREATFLLDSESRLRPDPEAAEHAPDEDVPHVSPTRP